MKKFLTGIFFINLCILVVPQSIGQQNILVDDDCNTATVDGIQGEIYRLTENGSSNWVILDVNGDYLADAPAHCIGMLDKMMQSQQPSVTSSLPATPRPGPGQIDPSEAGNNYDIVAAHNRVRRAVGIFEDMQWSDDLAAYAQEWADVLKTQKGCEIEHRPRTGHYAQKYGENLSWTGGITQSGSQAVSAWASEKSNYNYVTNSCSGVCGHYTQIIWRSSQYVGCATASCQSGMTTQLWVCNYAPAGNIMGEKPY